MSNSIKITLVNGNTDAVVDRVEEESEHHKICVTVKRHRLGLGQPNAYKSIRVSIGQVPSGGTPSNLYWESF